MIERVFPYKNLSFVLFLSVCYPFPILFYPIHFLSFLGFPLWLSVIAGWCVIFICPIIESMSYVDKHSSPFKAGRKLIFSITKYYYVTGEAPKNWNRYLAYAFMCVYCARNIWSYKRERVALFFIKQHPSWIIEHIDRSLRILIIIKGKSKVCGVSRGAD